MIKLKCKSFIKYGIACYKKDVPGVVIRHIRRDSHEGETVGMD